MFSLDDKLRGASGAVYVVHEIDLQQKTLTLFTEYPDGAGKEASRILVPFALAETMFQKVPGDGLENLTE